MILEREAVDKIKAGEITALVLPLAKADSYTIGRTYSVQAWRGGTATKAPTVSAELARILVTGVLRMRLDQLPEQQAQAAGWKDLAELYEHWQAAHGEGPLNYARCGVVLFEVDIVEPGRFLAPGPRGGYTTSPSQAMRGEPEVVSEAWAAEISTQGRRADAERLAEARAAHQAKPLWIRLEEAVRTAQRSGIDVSRQLAAIERRLESMEAKLQRECA